jgi:hypothetical protein
VLKHDPTDGISLMLKSSIIVVKINVFVQVKNR